MFLLNIERYFHSKALYPIHFLFSLVFNLCPIKHKVCLALHFPKYDEVNSNVFFVVVISYQTLQQIVWLVLRSFSLSVICIFTKIYGTIFSWITSYMNDKHLKK